MFHFQFILLIYLKLVLIAFVSVMGAFWHHGNVIKNNQDAYMANMAAENHDVIFTSCHFVSLSQIDDLNGDIFGNTLTKLHSIGS